MQGSDIGPRVILREYVNFYARSAWLLTFLALVIFGVSGFYTHGRAYQGRYKAAMVAQAVTLSYLTFVFCNYIVNHEVPVPNAAIVLAYVFTVTILVGARLWSRVWGSVMRSEQGRKVPADERSVQRVLVIGGDGYIGSALLPKLLAKGYHVRVLSLLLFGTEPIEGVLNHPRLEILRADFRHVDKVVEAMRDIDAVVHLGAIVGDPACALDEDLTIDVNLMATRMIAEVARGAGVTRFIFASTCSVYGASDEILDEYSALRPVSLYAQTKIACERILATMATEDFAPTFLRFGTIYGLSGRTRFDLVVNLLTAKAVVDGEITVVGGDQWRPFVHVDDAAESVARALMAPLSLVRNEVFNVGSDDQNFTILQVGELVQSLVPESRLVSWSSDSDRRNYRVSFGKIRSKLGFSPRWTVQRGVSQVIHALESGRVADYRDPLHSNVKFLSEEGIDRLERRHHNWAHELISELPLHLAEDAAYSEREEVVTRLRGETLPHGMMRPDLGPPAIEGAASLPPS
ncbi:MAG: NAD-dependent dehydratase [Chloroflexi bacterium]|nr:MAG: NAD-dependent dehydratase [Chloroflexota bacterium]